MSTMIAQTKRCTKCGQTKLLTEFSKNSEHSDGLASNCRKCVYENEKKWKKKNPEKVSARQKRWRDANRESQIVRCKEWRDNNQAYTKEYDKEYRQTHKQERAILQRNRKARERQSGVKITAQEWVNLKDKYGNKCLCCGRNDTVLAMDHVVPLSKGGIHSIDNIQPLCKSCNSHKSDKIIDYRPKD